LFFRKDIGSHIEGAFMNELLLYHFIIQDDMYLSIHYYFITFGVCYIFIRIITINKNHTKKDSTQALTTLTQDTNRAAVLN
jgi:hypothetical protein